MGVGLGNSMGPKGSHYWRSLKIPLIKYVWTIPSAWPSYDWSTYPPGNKGLNRPKLKGNQWLISPNLQCLTAVCSEKVAYHPGFGRERNDGGFGGAAWVGIMTGTFQISGQSIATSRDLTPKGSWEREIPLISGKSRLVKYYNLARNLEWVAFWDKLPGESWIMRAWVSMKEAFHRYWASCLLSLRGSVQSANVLWTNGSRPLEWKWVKLSSGLIGSCCDRHQPTHFRSKVKTSRLLYLFVTNESMIRTSKSTADRPIAIGITRINIFRSSHFHYWCFTFAHRRVMGEEDSPSKTLLRGSSQLVSGL